METRTNMVLLFSFMFITASFNSNKSLLVEQFDSLDDFYQAFKEHPEAIFIVIITWFVLIFLLSRFLDIRITPWIALMCLILAFFVGLWYISTYLVK